MAFAMISNSGCPLQWLIFCVMSIQIVLKYSVAYEPT